MTHWHCSIVAAIAEKEKAKERKKSLKGKERIHNNIQRRDTEKRKKEKGDRESREEEAEEEQETDEQAVWSQQVGERETKK